MTVSVDANGVLNVWVLPDDTMFGPVPAVPTAKNCVDVVNPLRSIMPPPAAVLTDCQLVTPVPSVVNT